MREEGAKRPSCASLYTPADGGIRRRLHENAREGASSFDRRRQTVKLPLISNSYQRTSKQPIPTLTANDCY